MKSLSFFIISPLFIVFFEFILILQNIEKI